MAEGSSVDTATAGQAAEGPWPAREGRPPGAPIVAAGVLRGRHRATTSRLVRYVTDPRDDAALGDAAPSRLVEVADRYAFRANDYYLGLIDWTDPDDPIRKLIVPDEAELDPWGRLDASNESAVTVAPGVQHKYRRTVLLLCNETCGGFCRYCFRKRLFMSENDEAAVDVSEGLRYIGDHPEVTNVLLTGGDPLVLSTRRIEAILAGLARIEHVRIVRIGTKMPAFNPWRILDDRRLLEAIRRHPSRRQRIYIMAHFDHPRELTEAARGCVRSLFDAGATVVNQCPIIRGVNDRGPVLGELFQRLSWIGVQPYYLFQCRPTVGNKPYVVPLVEGYGVFSDARRRASGLGRRARYCMSHSTGKISMVGLDREHIYLRYHQAKDPADEFRFMVFERDDEAIWVDELVPIGTGVRPSAEGRGADERSVGRHGPRSSNRIPAGAVEPIPSDPGDIAS